MLRSIKNMQKTTGKLASPDIAHQVVFRSMRARNIPVTWLDRLQLFVFVDYNEF